MGLFDVFKKQVSVPLHPLDDELASLSRMNGLSTTINAAIEQSVKAVDYFGYYDKTNDQGNYFGVEFDIQASATRIKTAFAKEPWMWTTAQLIARTLSSIPFVVKSKATNELVPNHPLNAQLKAANIIQDNMSMNWCGYLDLVLGGNYLLVFDEKYKNAMHVPIESIQINPPTDGLEVKTVTIMNPMTMRRSEVSYEQFVHFKFPNPFNPYFGISLYIAAARPILLDRFKNEYEMGFYLRGATNYGVVETTEDLGKTRLERLMRTWEQAYSGKRNWWRTAFLPKGAKWVNTGLTMNEMQHLEGLKENRLTMLAALGIPPSKVGIVQDVNRATSEEQNLTFWENTIVPFSKFIAAGWNNSYLVRKIYGGKVIVEPDFGEIEALQGSLIKKGEKAKAVETAWTIDEIREKIYAMPPIGDERGSKLIAEIRATPTQTISDMLSLPPPKQNDNQSVSNVETPEEKFKKEVLSLKAQTVESQERIETKFTENYLIGYDKYIEQIILITEHALKNNRDVRTSLVAAEKPLLETYIKSVGVELVKAMDRGFSFANSQAKGIPEKMLVVLKAKPITDVDQQAIDVLKEETTEGRRATLVRRAIENFVGFNQTRTNEILNIVTSGLERGRTLDKIAAAIRQDYKENYSGQSSTIARTEILSAISQGIKWNNDILGEVFSDVQKQWFHVGDVGSNPDAREQHAQFEKLGPMPSNYMYGGVLSYPRDPNGGADQIINCRCSLTSVIPAHATSNAEVILNRH